MAAMLRRLATAYLKLVAESGEDIRVRQHPHSSWSALECAAHVSDVFQRSGVLLGRFLAHHLADARTAVDGARVDQGLLGHLLA
jgi:hypothetical protein